MRDGLLSILEEGHFHGVTRLHTDRGKEYYNNLVGQLLDDWKIKLYSTYSQEMKAAIAERTIQTLKRRIYRYLTENNTNKYIDILTDLTNSYNLRKHRGLKDGATPSVVHSLTHPDDIKAQFKKMYIDNNTRRVQNVRDNHSLSVGDTVRASLEARTGKFFRGFNVVNTEENFRIREIDRRQRVRAYLLEDLDGTPLDGIFYREELVRTTLPEFFPIRVLRERENRLHRGKEFLVEWIGYPSSTNSWIPASDLIQNACIREKRKEKA